MEYNDYMFEGLGLNYVKPNPKWHEFWNKGIQYFEKPCS